MEDRHRSIVTTVLAAVLAFCVGALWQYTTARSLSGELETAEYELSFQKLEATLGAATIEAQRGSYEIARQLASDFYSGLQTSITEAPAEGQTAFQDMLTTRDAVITALSRNDPQSGSMLAQLFVRYRIAMGEPVGPQSGTVSPAPAPPLTTGAP